jgi:hypothetical protein
MSPLEPALTNMRARWYNSQSGVFTSVDPAIASTNQPYQYANGDPVNNSDPSGLAATLGYACSDGSMNPKSSSFVVSAYSTCQLNQSTDSALQQQTGLTASQIARLPELYPAMTSYSCTTSSDNGTCWVYTPVLAFALAGTLTSYSAADYIVYVNLYRPNTVTLEAAYFTGSGYNGISYLTRKDFNKWYAPGEQGNNVDQTLQFIKLVGWSGLLNAAEQLDNAGHLLGYSGCASSSSPPILTV